MSIQVKNLKYVYSQGTPYESVALDDVTFNIDDGEFVGIIGHTGSGKSTLVQHFNGILKPTSGDIVVNDTDLTKPKTSMLEIRRKIGLVFQYPEYQLFEETVYKDIAFGPKNLKLGDQEIDERVKEAMKLVDLDFDTYWERSPFELSGGQKRRVAIAGVIAMKPEVLILDEPTAGLDPKAHMDILAMINNIHNVTKNITIFVSHNMNDVANFCDKVLVMDKGKLWMNGTPAEVFSNGEELEAIGLDLPDVTKLMLECSRLGFDVPKGIFDFEVALCEIEKIIEKGREQ